MLGDQMGWQGASTGCGEYVIISGELEAGNTLRGTRIHVGKENNGVDY